MSGLADQSPDQADRYASVPFVGYRGPLPPKTPSRRSLSELVGIPIVLGSITFMAWLLTLFPSADRDDLDLSEISVELGGTPDAGLGSGVAPDVAPTQEEQAPTKPPKGPASEHEPLHTAPVRTGVGLASERPRDAVVVKPSAPARPFFTGDQIGGRRPAPNGTTGGTGAGSKGDSDQSRRSNSVGSLAAPGGGGSRSGRRLSGSGGQGTLSAGSSGSPARGSLTVSDLWEASSKAKSAGGGGGSNANVVATSTRYLLQHPVTSTNGVERGEWLVHSRGTETCALAQSDRTIVCARPGPNGTLRAFVGGPSAGKYGTTEAALHHLARLLGGG